MAEKKWIQGMHMDKGVLTAKAKKAGLSITEFCARGGHDTKTKKQCILAHTLKSLKK